MRSGPKLHRIHQPQGVDPRGRLENANQDVDRSGWHAYVKKGTRRAKEVLLRSITYDPEESDGDRWWFWDQHLLKGSRTLGKAKKESQGGRWLGAFLATLLARPWEKNKKP